MKSKHWFVLVTLVIALAMVLSACQPQTVVQTVEVEKIVEKEVEVEKIVEKEVIVEVEAEGEIDLEEMEREFLNGKMICAVLPGPTNDAGWTTNAYKGLVNLRDNFGMKMAYRENTLPEETVDLMREYAESGCDWIHAHGFEYFDQVNQVAAEYPEIQFSQTSRGTGMAPNIIGLSFISGEEGYVAGRIAGFLTKTGKITWIVGESYPALTWNHEQAKVAAADMVAAGLIDEPFDAAEIQVGSWIDPVKAKELTAGAIAEGYDVFVMVADAGDPGIIEAIEEARSAGKEAWAISGVGDKNYLGPEFVVGGYEEKVSMQLQLAGQAFAMAGKPTYADMPVGMREKAITLAPFYGLLTEEQEANVLEWYKCYVEKGKDCELMGDVQFRTDL